MSELLGQSGSALPRRSSGPTILRCYLCVTQFYSRTLAPQLTSCSDIKNIFDWPFCPVPLRERVADPSATRVGRVRGSLQFHRTKQTPHPRRGLRPLGTLSHKGRGKRVRGTS